MKRLSLPRKCLLIVPPNIDVSPVTSSLGSRGIIWRRWDSFDWGVTLGSLKDVVESSDFVCVYSTGVLSQNMIFELGIAIGLSKPVFIVTNGKVLVPIDLRSISSISSKAWNPPVIEPHLDAFLETLQNRGSRKLP